MQNCFETRQLAIVLLLLAASADLLAQSDDSTSSIPVEVQTLKREGYGATSKGGDGGRVVWVTNLKDAGPGSLREALAIKEPRIVRDRTGEAHCRQVRSRHDRRSFSGGA